MCMIDRSRGFTLIELIIGIVVLAAGLTGILLVFNQTVMRSADPMLQQQALAIAEGYLDEALLKAYADPEGDAGCETSRALYDDVADYACVNDSGGALDQYGHGLAGLAEYNVVMTVVDVSLGSGTNAAAARRVEVVVTHDKDPGLRMVLSGFRGNY